VDIYPADDICWRIRIISSAAKYQKKTIFETALSKFSSSITFRLSEGAEHLNICSNNAFDCPKGAAHRDIYDRFVPITVRCTFKADNQRQPYKYFGALRLYNYTTEQLNIKTCLQTVPSTPFATPFCQPY
jgi:hypothetical protein